MKGEHNWWTAYHAVREVLTPDLLKPGHTGHCYHASEALWHLLGGTGSGWKAAYVWHRGDTHWFLVSDSGGVLDPTEDQFPSNDPPPYGRAKRVGFLTGESPSKRAAEVLRRVEAARRAREVDAALRRPPTAAEVARTHRRVMLRDVATGEDTREGCSECWRPWPCDAARLSGALETLREAVGGWEPYCDESGPHWVHENGARQHTITLGPPRKCH